jgi:hypothetical protein
MSDFVIHFPPLHATGDPARCPEECPWCELEPSWCGAHQQRLVGGTSGCSHDRPERCEPCSRTDTEWLRCLAADRYRLEALAPEVVRAIVALLEVDHAG